MQTSETALYEWQPCFTTEAADSGHLAHLFFPQNFHYLQCSYDHGYRAENRQQYESANCQETRSLDSSCKTTHTPFTAGFVSAVKFSVLHSAE